MSDRRPTGTAVRLALHFEEILAGAALVVVVAAVCWGVVTRYLTEQPAAWSGEVAQIAFAWTVFLGAAACFKYGMHISIDMLVALLPQGLRRIVQLVADLLVLAFLAYLAWLALLFNIEAWHDPTSVLRLPRTVVYASVLVGALCMVVRQLQLTARRLSGIEAPILVAAEPQDSGA